MTKHTHGTAEPHEGWTHQCIGCGRYLTINGDGPRFLNPKHLQVKS